MSQNGNETNGIGVRELIVADQHVDDVHNSALTVYENRDVVRELTARMMMFHPAAGDVGERGMILAAQLALTMGASPFPGMNEIHVYTDSKGKIIVQPGINYWERRALYFGGVRWIDPVRPMTIDEIDQYQIENGSFVGAICRGVRARELRARIHENRELGIDDEPTSEIKRSIMIVGKGVAHRGTYQHKGITFFIEAKNGRPLIWTAEKRAETDFYKKAFPFIPGERVPAGAGLTLLAEPDGDVRYIPNTDSREWKHTAEHETATWANIKPDDPPPAHLDVDQINYELGLTDEPPTRPTTDADPDVIEGESETVETFDVDADDFDPNIDGDPEPTGDPEQQPLFVDGEGGS